MSEDLQSAGTSSTEHVSELQRDIDSLIRQKGGAELFVGFCVEKQITEKTLEQMRLEVLHQFSQITHSHRRNKFRERITRLIAKTRGRKKI